MMKQGNSTHYPDIKINDSRSPQGLGQKLEELEVKVRKDGAKI